MKIPTIGPRMTVVIVVLIAALAGVALFAPEQFDHILNLFGDTP